MVIKITTSLNNLHLLLELHKTIITTIIYIIFRGGMARIRICPPIYHYHYPCSEIIVNYSYVYFFQHLVYTLVALSISLAVQYPTNPTSEMSADEKNLIKVNKSIDQSDESGHEIDPDGEEIKDKKYLVDAMRTILDPNTVIEKSSDDVEKFKSQLDELNKENMTLEKFTEEMDKLSLDVCKTSQEALWSYVTDIGNEAKKNKMVRRFFNVHV